MRMIFRKKAEVSPEMEKMHVFTTILMKLELPKKIIRFGVNFFAEHIVSDAIALKKKYGFNNPEVKIIYEVMSDVIQKNEKAWTLPKMPAYNKDRRLWTNLRDISTLIADSDSYYTLRTFYILNGLFEREAEFQMAKHKEMPYWNYEEFCKAKAYQDMWEKKVEELRKQDLEKMMGEINEQTKL